MDEFLTFFKVFSTYFLVIFLYQSIVQQLQKKITRLKKLKDDYMKSYEKCVRGHKLSKVSSPNDFVQKEMIASDNNLTKAKQQLETDDYLNSISSAYYAMFHAVKALTLNKGIQEKNHVCLISSLQELYVKTGEMKPKYIQSIDECFKLNQAANSEKKLYKENAETAVSYAIEFSSVAHGLLDGTILREVL